MTTTWASKDDSASLFAIEVVLSGLTVQLIATPRGQLMTCKADEPLREVMSRNTDRFDYLPVLEPSDSAGRIVGLFHAADYFVGPVPEGSIGEYQAALSENHAIGGDASVLDFVRDADRRPCCLVFSGPRISGLVSFSDMQKLPVRASLFALITGLEISMADAIRRRHETDSDWMTLLSEGRRRKIAEEAETSRHGDGYVDDLLFTQFCDKADIIAKTLPPEISKKQWRKDLKGLGELRDLIAHGNDYASTRQHAKEVSRLVRVLLDRQRQTAKLFQ